MASLLGLGDVPSREEQLRVVETERFPFASVYLNPSGMAGGEARDRIAGFARALGARARIGENEDNADHLARILGLWAWITEWRAKEPDRALQRLLDEARRTLIAEHVLTWTPAYLLAFRGCEVRFYEAWSSLLLEAIREGAEGLSPGPALSHGLDNAPSLSDPRRLAGSASAWSLELCAPARTGFVLLRSDLRRMARSLNVPLRSGERAFALAEFIRINPPGALLLLSRHARDWAARFRPLSFGKFSDWWSARALRSSKLLESLARDARAALSAASEFDD